MTLKLILLCSCTLLNLSLLGSLFRNASTFACTLAHSSGSAGTLPLGLGVIVGVLAWLSLWTPDRGSGITPRPRTLHVYQRRLLVAAENGLLANWETDLRISMHEKTAGQQRRGAERGQRVGVTSPATYCVRRRWVAAPSSKAEVGCGSWSRHVIQGLKWVARLSLSPVRSFRTRHPRRNVSFRCKLPIGRLRLQPRCNALPHDVWAQSSATCRHRRSVLLVLDSLHHPLANKHSQGTSRTSQHLGLYPGSGFDCSLGTGPRPLCASV
jgi:hypothetical protein